jgi:regulator of replication initiation timing
MEKQRLRELLGQLHEELDRTDAVDESTADVLADLKEDISRLVREEVDIDDEQEGLTERLNEVVGDFEEDHPKLTIMIQHVLDSLARMGF